MPENSPAWLERTALLVGEEALQALKRATVVVAGLGGVGAYAAEMTARAGVGRMIIIDSDKVSESNRNRQLLALRSTLGRPKTEVMAERLLDINPELQIIKVEEYLTEDNVAALLERSCTEAGVSRPDFLIDAIDTLSPKIALIAHCVHSGIPLVSSMGAGAKFDATKVRLTDLSKSYNCPPWCSRRNCPTVTPLSLPRASATRSPRSVLSPMSRPSSAVYVRRPLWSISAEGTAEVR